jgi:hypothetical protein
MMIKNTTGLILFICVITTAAMAAPLELRIDLNGDGTPDKVRAQKTDSGYTLMVNDLRVVEQDHEKTLLRMEGLDIDREDGMQELRVIVEVDGGYAHSDIYAYDGRHIIRLVEITGSVTVPGSGELYVNRWHGNFSTTARFRLSQRPPKLTETPQSLYFIGLTVTVSTSFPIWLQRHEPKSLIYVSPGSALSILAVDLDAPECDKMQTGHCDVFLIRTSTNLTGWVKRSQLERHVQGLHSAG